MNSILVLQMGMIISTLRFNDINVSNQKYSILESLPHDILLEICLWLQLKDFKNAKLSSKRMNKILKQFNEKLVFKRGIICPNYFISHLNNMKDDLAEASKIIQKDDQDSLFFQSIVKCQDKNKLFQWCWERNLSKSFIYGYLTGLFWSHVREFAFFYRNNLSPDSQIFYYLDLLHDSSTPTTYEYIRNHLECSLIFGLEFLLISLIIRVQDLYIAKMSFSRIWNYRKMIWSWPHMNETQYNRVSYSVIRRSLIS